MNTQVTAFNNLEDIFAFETVPLEFRLAERTTYDALKNAAQKFPQRCALIFLAEGDPLNQEKAIHFTYQQLFEKVQQTANLLVNLGIKKGNAVSYILSNCPENYFLLFAAQAVGIANPISPYLEDEQILELLETAESKLLITSTEEKPLWARNRQVISLAKNKRLLQELIEQQPITFHCQADAHDVCSYFHTSSTTNEPKLVKHSHWGNLHMALLCGIYAQYYHPNTVIPSLLPMFHVAAPMLSGVSAFLYGATVIVTSPWGWRDQTVINNFWKIIEAYQATSMLAAFFTYNAILQIPLGDAKITSLRCAVSSLTPSTHDLNKFKELTGLAINTLWGQTEVTALGAFNSSQALPGDKHFGSVGLRCPYQEMKIAHLNEKGHYISDCETGEVGALMVRGPNVIGYKKPELNNSAFTESGWFITGDWAYQDEQGYFWIVCRISDFIYQQGKFISLLDVENAMRQHPAIKKVAALGVPDPNQKDDKILIGFIELQETATLSVEEFHTWIQDKLIHHPELIPKKIIIKKDMPMNGTGKVLKHKLAQMYI